MKKINALKGALLAAASLAAVSASVSAAPMSSADPAPIEHAVVVAPHDDAESRAADSAFRGWLAGGAVAAALAGLIRLFGWSRIADALGKAGSALAAAPAAAVRFAGEAIKTPLRSLLVIGGLSLFALTGVGLYDVEWLAGVATGATLVVAGIVGFRRFGRLFARR
jgi:hypothetical protein